MVVAALLLLPHTTTNAQSGENPSPPVSPPANQNIRFEHLTTEDGLSSDRVVTILQDNQGFMWFGTFDGLNRYDGYEFKVFRHDPQNPHSLNSNLIVALLQDRDGFLWVGTSGGGLNRYDPSTEQFTHYTYDISNPNSIGSNTVIALLQDYQGEIWVGTDGGGLNRYDSINDGFIRYQNDPDNPNSLSDNTVWSILEGAKDKLWVGTDNGGLNQFDRQNGQFKVFRHDSEDPNSLTQGRVTALYQDQEDILWIGTRGGLDRLDTRAGKFKHYRYDPEDPNSLSDNFVTDILKDSAGYFWVGSNGGLNRFDSRTGKFLRYTADQNDNYSLSHDSAKSFYFDASGLLWIATIGGGVNKLDLQAKPFTQYCDSYNESYNLGFNDVQEIYVNPQGEIWIGTIGGLIRFDCQNETKSYFTPDAEDPKSLSSNQVRSIVQDKKDLLWLGTQGGVNRYDPLTNEFTTYRADPSDPKGLLSDAVWSVHLDSQGMLWVGSALGLNQFDPRTEKFTAAYRPDPNNPHSLSGNTVTVIHEDQDGALWIGTLGDGLNHFNRETGRFNIYRNNPDNPSSIVNNSINAILVDSEQRLWIGTGAGLELFNRVSEEFVHYGESQGLPSVNIAGILEEDLYAEQGSPNLWISTSLGLYKFNPETSTVRHYDTNDKLPGSNFNRNSAFKNTSGKLYFGSSTGLTAFYPTQIHDSSFIPPVVITDFQLGNKSVEIGDDSVLQEAVTAAEYVTLSYQDRIVSFEFSALDYRAPVKNRYRYKLVGFDEGWTEVGSDRRYVTYTNLDPGEYVFRVLGSNSDGVWNKHGTSLGITITPPWWLTTWALGLFLILIVAGLFCAYRWRVKYLESRSRQLEKQVAEKTRLLDRRVKELDTLLSVSQDITSTLDLEQLLILILDELYKVVDYDVATIRRLVQGKMELKAHRWLFQQAGQPSLHLSTEQIPIIRDMIQSQEVILVGDHHFAQDIVGDMDLHEFELTGEVLKASRSLMVGPLVVKGEVIGMLVLGHHQPDCWNDEAKELVQAFANQAAVAIANAELFEKAGKTATLEERNRLARELHDSATQELYSATLFSEAGKELAEQGDLESAGYYLSRVGEVVDQALKDMRLLVFQLRPQVLEKEGLVGAIQKRLDSVEKRAGIESRLISDPMIAIPDEISAELYAITLEALNNVLKHAESGSVVVNIHSDGDIMTLEVVDEGKGFDLENMYDSGGMGLENMGDRAERLGGDLTIESTLDQGTRVKVSLPVTQKPVGGSESMENS